MTRLNFDFDVPIMVFRKIMHKIIYSRKVGFSFENKKLINANDTLKIEVAPKVFRI